MADLATLKARLTEAEDAYHKLMTGQRAVTVQYDTGIEVQYTQASNVQPLRDYIERLKARIAELEGATSGRRRAVLVSY